MPDDMAQDLQIGSKGSKDSKFACYMAKLTCELWAGSPSKT